MVFELALRVRERSAPVRICPRGKRSWPLCLRPVVRGDIGNRHFKSETFESATCPVSACPRTDFEHLTLSAALSLKLLYKCSCLHAPAEL